MNIVIDSAVTETLLYHEQTKHHLHRYANSLGFLDWANQPNPFRCYEGVTVVRLPLLQKDPAGEHLALYERSRNAFQDFTHGTIGAFLELSLGLSAWKSIPGSSWALRMNPYHSPKKKRGGLRWGQRPHQKPVLHHAGQNPST